MALARCPFNGWRAILQLLYQKKLSKRKKTFPHPRYSSLHQPAKSPQLLHPSNYCNDLAQLQTAQNGHPHLVDPQPRAAYRNLASMYGHLPLLCRNPNLGLATKARCGKVVNQEGDPGVTSHAPGSAKSVREWTLTLPSELPCWELKSRMDFQIFKVQLQGSKLLALKKSLYHWKIIKA